MDSKTSFDYKQLAKFILPDGILDYFEVTAICKETIEKVKEMTGNSREVLHIHLDERDNRNETWHDLRPNGFTESSRINDFPIRDHKVVLHVRRRRWLDKDGHNVIINNYELVAKNTSYSPEFADVLKKMYGQLCDYSPFTKPVL